MGFKSRKFALSGFLSVLLIFALVSGAQAYSNVLAFGDSLSDNGTSDYDPFGAIAMTNGAVWVEYLADNLGATLNDMAYSGATTAQDNPALELDITGLQWQVGTFEYYFNEVADDTLITITAGGNDMFNGRSAVEAAYNIAGVIGYLMELGGSDFMVMNLSTSQQNDAYTAWMNAFNTALAGNLAALSYLNPNADLFLLDMNGFVADVDNYTDTWVAMCAADPSACADTTYAWYDTVGVHPTTEVHQQIAAYATQMVTPVPEPASVFLLLTGLAGLVGVRRKRKQ